jgi:AcrR family transcriptional regulator
MSVREASKDKRRQRITQAARALIHANGTDGFSMRSLATKAGVSVATPYNLFGSKRLVVLSVLQGEIDRFQSKIVHDVEDPVSTLFSVASLVVEQSCEDPTLHRSMLKFLRQEESETQRHMSAFSDVNSNVFNVIIDAAKAKKQLREDTITHVVAEFLEYSLSTVLGLWVEGLISDEDLENRTAFAFCLALVSFSTEKELPGLLVRLQVNQSRISNASIREAAKTLDTERVSDTVSKLIKVVG